MKSSNSATPSMQKIPGRFLGNPGKEDITAHRAVMFPPKLPEAHNPFSTFDGSQMKIIFAPVCASQKFQCPCVLGAPMPLAQVCSWRLPPLADIPFTEKGGTYVPPFRLLKPALRYSYARPAPWWRRRRSCGYIGPWPRRAWPSQWRPSGCCSSPSASRGRRRPCQWGSG